MPAYVRKTLKPARFIAPKARNVRIRRGHSASISDAGSLSLATASPPSRQSEKSNATMHQ